MNPIDRVRVLDANERNLCVDLYRDVPMSDIELLFPHKKVSMRTTDKMWLGLSGLVGVTSAFPLLDPSTHLTWGWIVGLVALVSYQVRVLSRSYLTWRYYETLSGSLLANKLLASGASAAEWVNYEAADQSVKEMAITFVALCELEQTARSRTNRPRETVTSQPSGKSQRDDDLAFNAEQVNEQAILIAKSICGPHHNFFQAQPNLLRLEEMGIVKRCPEPGPHSSPSEQQHEQEAEQLAPKYFALNHTM
jgi:hypothetical protein